MESSKNALAQQENVVVQRGNTLHSFYGFGLIGITWVVSIIQVWDCIAYIFWGMLASSSSLTNATLRLAIWPIISVVAMAIFAKRHRFTITSKILFAIPVLLNVSRLFVGFFSLKGYILFLLFPLGIGAGAFFYDFRVAPKKESSYALEIVFVGVCLLTIFWISKVVLNSIEAKNINNQQVAQYYKTKESNAFYATFFPALKEALPDKVGAWNKIETMVPSDNLTHLSATARFDQPRDDGVWALYEDSGHKASSNTDIQNRYEEHIKDVDAKLKLNREEYEAKEKNDRPGPGHDARLARLIELNHEATCLRRQLQWPEMYWRLWGATENQLRVRISLFLPGDTLNIAATWHNQPKSFEPGVILPWGRWPETDLLDEDVKYICFLGRSKQNEESKSFILSCTYFGNKSFPLDSLGMEICVTARDSNRAKAFIEKFDLSAIKAIISRTGWIDEQKLKSFSGK